jgi:hypothetical protein
MKLATEDCIAKIVDYFKSQTKVPFDKAALMDPKQWKRIKKSGNKKDGFIRLFVHRGLDDTCNKANVNNLDVQWVFVVKSTETDITELHPAALVAGKLVEKQEDFPSFLPIKGEKDEAPEVDFIKELAESPETLPTKKKKVYYFELCPPMYNFPSKFDSIPIVQIVSKTYWEKHHGFDDSITSENTELPEGFCDGDDGHFEYEGTKEEATEKLLKAGFVPLPKCNCKDCNNWRRNENNNPVPNPQNSNSANTVQNKNIKHPTLAELKANPITVPLGLQPNKKEDLSGRVIYDLGGDGLKCRNISFHCGPEQEDGALDDREGGFGNDERLEKLFADFGKHIFIGAAENYHTAKLIPGISAKELWEVIVERLKRSGAVLMEGGHDGSNEDDEDDYDEDEEDDDSNDTEAKFQVNAFDGKVSVQFYVPAEGEYLDKAALSNLNIPSSKFSVPMLNPCGIAYLDFNGAVADCKTLLISYGYHEYFAGSEERKLAEQIKNAKFNAADWVFGFKADEGEYGEGYIYLIKKAFWDKEK